MAGSDRELEHFLLVAKASAIESTLDILMLPTFAPLPLGQRIPDSVHGVSCSLPTMRSVIGYEERDPEVLRQLSSGYPRFVIHPLVRRLSELFASELGLVDHSLWLTASARAADDLATELGMAHVLRTSHDGLPIVAHPESSEVYARAKVFLQNTGGFLSSREAEDHLFRRGLLAEVQPEKSLTEGALVRVTERLKAFYPGTTDRDVILCPSGMNAFSAAWRSLADLQRSRSKTVWIQLGWLYLDTMATLRRFAAQPDQIVHLAHVHDMEALATACEAAGDRLAGLVTETPTNPLIQTADLEAASQLVWRKGGHMLVDPTLASPLNVNVLGYSDIVVNSLTKYAASEGDVIAGAVIINPKRADASYFRTHVARRADSIYRRDLNRLAVEIEDYELFVEQTNRSTLEIVNFLQHHPQVEEVHWSLRTESRDAYMKVARSEKHIGAVLSFSVRQPLAEFYDRVRLPKGASFGMKTTLLCPFIYLAHYDLVCNSEGRATLAVNGINPDLLRLSVGIEPVEEIIATLDEGLRTD